MPAARPKKKPVREPAHWRARVTISIPQDVAEQIKQAAEADGRTVSNYLVQLFLRERERSGG